MRFVIKENGMNAKIISLISVVIIFSGLSVVVSGDVSDGTESATTITDGTGRTFDYTEPAEHVVTMGYASTLTISMLGEIDKIIAVDKYSTYSYTKDERLRNLNAQDMGSIYTDSNNDLIVTQFVQWVQEGKMSLHDTIILTTYANANVLRDKLNAAGFDKVLVYMSVTKYDRIIDFVNSMSIIATGGVSSIVNDMKLVETTISDRLEGVEKAAAMSVWYYASSGFSVGNAGSIAVSLIEAAGGINIAYDSSVTKPTYGNASNIVQLVEANPNVVIFLSDTYIKEGHTIGDFRQAVFGEDIDVKVVVMNANWNNYDPDAAEGLWAFASALHPDLFDGPAPYAEEGPSGSNLALYAVAGIITVMIILGAAYFFMRKP